MNREEFMKRLADLLAGLPYEERREALDYYENYFEDAGMEHEMDVIDELISPEHVAVEILRGEKKSFQEEAASEQKFLDYCRIGDNHCRDAGSESTNPQHHTQSGCGWQFGQGIHCDADG